MRLSECITDWIDATEPFVGEITVCDLIHGCFCIHSGSTTRKGLYVELISTVFRWKSTGICDTRSEEWAWISQAGTEPNSVRAWQSPSPPFSFSFPLTWFQSHSQHKGTGVSETGRWKENGWLDYDTPSMSTVPLQDGLQSVAPTPRVHLLRLDAINPITIVMILTDLFWAICHRRNKSLPLSPGHPKQKTFARNSLWKYSSTF